MKMTIQVIIEDDDMTSHEAAAAKSITLERNVEDLRPETLGLKLDEAKEILAEIQSALVTAQVARFQECQCSCPECGTPFQKNGTHQLTFRTLFGTIKLTSQRFYTCSCQQATTPPETNKPVSFSPLAKRLPERTAPEFLYLQTRWAAIMSYGCTAELLEEVLPLEKRISTATLAQHVRQIATRVDGELSMSSARKYTRATAWQSRRRIH